MSLDQRPLKAPNIPSPFARLMVLSVLPVFLASPFPRKFPPRLIRASAEVPFEQRSTSSRGSIEKKPVTESSQSRKSLGRGEPEAQLRRDTGLGRSNGRRRRGMGRDMTERTRERRNWTGTRAPWYIDHAKAASIIRKVCSICSCTCIGHRRDRSFVGRRVCCMG